MSEAHSVLSDANTRRQYDASRPAQSFGPQSTGGGRMHPYAAQAAAEAAARGYTGGPDYTARRMYGIDEEVWIAHHYGVHSRRSGMPNRYYGMNIVEERIEEEQERIQRYVGLHLSCLFCCCCCHVFYDGNLRLLMLLLFCVCVAFIYSLSLAGSSTTSSTRPRATSCGARRV